MIAACVGDYRELARRRLPRYLFDYIDGGSFAEQTLAANVADLARVNLRQRVLRDVSRIDLSTTVLGQPIAMPVALGPVGMAGMNARRGEVQAARAAERAGIPFTLSTVSTCSLAEVRSHVAKPLWFQLYMIRDRGILAELLSAAARAHCSALLFTVDLPLPSSRYRDVRSSLKGDGGARAAVHRMMQSASRLGWLYDVALRGRPHTLGNIAPVFKGRATIGEFQSWVHANFDPSVTWADLEWVRARWRGPLVVKGVLEPEDAREAHRVGADAVVVSNHGGRQLDGAPSTVRALPRILDAIGSDLPVFVDGGVRSGLDVVRMLALGARLVLLGRAWAYALAASGEAGVEHVLGLIAKELRVAMSLVGKTRVNELSTADLWTQAPPRES
jgi:L-lactate dehydrogenase (cytochrome)